MKQQKDDDWRITVDVPLGLSEELREKLFDAVSDVVFDWEPADRVGWDAWVSASSADHSLEAYANRLEAENEYLKSRLDAALLLLNDCDGMEVSRVGILALRSALTGNEEGMS